MRTFYMFSTIVIATLLGLFGGWIILNPTISLRAMTLTIGSIFILHGLIEIFSFIRERKVWNISFLYFVSGFVSLSLGIFSFWKIELAERTFVIVIAIWLFVTALLQITAALTLRSFRGWGYLFTIGLLLLIFAVFSFLSKDFFSIGISVFVGTYFIAQAFALILFALLLGRIRTQDVFRD